MEECFKNLKMKVEKEYGVREMVRRSLGVGAGGQGRVVGTRTTEPALGEKGLRAAMLGWMLQRKLPVTPAPQKSTPDKHQW